MAQRFERKHIIRLARLHNMMYRPAEIAKEIGVTPETVLRSYLPGGAPFEKDKNGDFWLHGPTFAAWVETVRERGKMGSLEDGQAWCLKCNAVVMMVKPRRKHLGRYTAIFQGTCSVCGTKVNRAYAASEDPTNSQAAKHD